MDIIMLTILGILSSILVFGVKTGLGCGFANIRKYEIVMVSAGYFVISIIMGYLVGIISGDLLETVLVVGVPFHILLAGMMIAAGIYTRKQWNCGCDVSRCTFVFLSLLCPVCLSALFIAITMLAAVLDLSGTLIGIIVGSVFFLSTLVSSLSFRSLGKTPETLGSVMMFTGIFYVLGAVIVPAYMQSKTLVVPQLTVDTGVMLASSAVLVLFITLGFAAHHLREG